MASLAHADDWGCQVLLCLANPQGPMAVSECVPPISRLYREVLFTPFPRPFPTCEMQPSPVTGQKSWAQQHQAYYDECPAGTTAVPWGVSVAQGRAGAAQTATLQAGEPLWTGIGEQGQYEEDAINRQKVCAGGETGVTQVYIQNGDDGDWKFVTQYQRIVVLERHPSPNAIDVYIDGALYRRVRY